MSTGRHAKKRAAQAEERLMNEQEELLKREEAKKGAMEKDVESQRIATMRARFGGQAPSSGEGASSGDANSVAPANASQKYKTPNRLMTGGTADPMKQTIYGMMLDNDQQGG